MSQTRPSAGGLHRASVAAGLLTSVLGLGGMAGWHLGSPLPVQPHPVFTPLWYSAAACLALIGAGLVALGLGWPRTTRALGAATALGGLVLLIQLVTGLDVGLDGFFFHPGATFTAARPGRPGPGTAYAVWLAGAGLFAASWPAVRDRYQRVISLGGASVVILSLVNLARYVFDLRQVGPLSQSTMAGQEAVGLLLAGLVVVSCASSTGASRAGAQRWAPLAACVGSLTMTLVLWQAITAQEHRRISRMVQFDATTIHRALVENSEQQAHPLLETARKLSAQPRPGARKLDSWAADYIGQHPGCLGIAVDIPGESLEWTAGVDNLEEALFASNEEQRAVLAQLREARKECLARAPRGWTGRNRCVLLYAPIDTERGAGGLLAVFRLQPYLDTVLGPNVAPGYAVVITDGEQQVYSRLAADRDGQEDWQQVNRVSFHGLEWQVQIWPTSYVMAREPISLARVALVVGALLVALLTLAVYLAQTARDRARALETEVNERKHAEKALRENEAKYRSLVENLENSVFLKDRDGRYLAVNKHFCQSLGREEAAVRGHTDFDLFPRAEAEQSQLDDRQVIAEAAQVEKEVEVTTDGKRRRLRIIRTPVKDDGGQVVGVLGIIWEVTEQRALEDHVRQAQKMEAVGQLAGGIAHDFNNLLTAILGNLSLIHEGLRPDDPNRPLIQTAEKAAARAASLTAQLLGFARQTKLRPQPLDLNAVIDEVTAILSRTIDPRIHLETRKAPDAWAIEADPGQMTQVLMNLCLNARDSMPDQGRLALETENVEIGEDFTRHHLDARTGAFVRLRVSDTGCGMPPQVKARIFEPFFTTKGPGKGTGLGLAMVFGIVKSHHGWIDCSSEVGRGTRFDIYLPRLRGHEPRPGPASTPVRCSDRSGRETILLADDEPMIRSLGQTILEQQGYRIVLAEDGEQAVDLYRRQREGIDLVILDLTMPNLSGQDAFRQIIAMNPRARVLFASGYSADHVTEAEQRRILGFVNKPYRPADLVHAARMALDAPLSPSTQAEVVCRS